jgi:formiminotetrahydrofolate cyclodeaminase
MDFPKMSLSEFAASVGSGRPVPGGGSVAAYCGELAASLVSMVCNLTQGKKGYESVQKRISSILERSGELITGLQELVSKDSEAFSKVSSAMKLPRGNEVEIQVREERKKEALKEATNVPLRTMELSSEVYSLAKELSQIGNKSARSDSETSMLISKAAFSGALKNVEINLESLKEDKAFVENTRRVVDSLVQSMQ